MGSLIVLGVLLFLVALAALRLWERRRYATLRRLADVLLARSTFNVRQGNRDGLLAFRLRQAARRGAQEGLANRIRKEQGNAQSKEMQAVQARDLQELYKQRKARKRLKSET